MNDAQREAIRRALQERIEEGRKNPDDARKRLVREGLYTEQGELTPMYGGRRVAAG